MRKIATLISVYNGDNPKDFRAAVESVLAQQFSTEVQSRIYLAVDGPVSADIDEEIIDLEPQLYRVHRIKENSGLASALNLLIRNLEDEDFIFRMDADDISRPARYETQINYLLQKEEVDILGTDIVEIDTDTGTHREVKFARTPQEARDRIYWRVPVAHPTVCFRRRAIDKIEGYPDKKNNEDIALWFRCVELGLTFDNVHEPLYEFKIDRNFWERRSTSKAIEEWRCYVEGGRRLEGISWKWFFPTARLIMRLSPSYFQKLIYNSRIRRS
ncbi:glycosyltransferase [Limimaricola cinnabarinus]|uniref:glycosyltransferase n=1 Tax=Limimaricola cinnabarinus TaxID=1125964 RepID=UPI002FE273F0